MPRVEVFISNGSDTNRYRDIAQDVLKRLQQLMQTELNYDVTISTWDYRLATPGIVAAEDIAGPSLRVVDRSHALLAIFGRRLPSITCKEVAEMLIRKQGGERVELLVYVNPKLKGPNHDAFFAELKAKFGVAIVWAPYHDALSFQAIVYTSLMRFLLDHLEIRNPGLVMT